MELQTFVKESLKQLVAGVADAQAECDALGARINPRGLTYHKSEQDSIFFDELSGTVAEPVEFDVAVSAGDSTGTKGGAGIVVGPIALGTQGKSQSQNSSVSRIKFRMLVMLPSVAKAHDN